LRNAAGFFRRLTMKNYDFSSAAFDKKFYEEFGDSFLKRLRRKFYYTKAENKFVFSIFGGAYKRRPNWDCKIID